MILQGLVVVSPTAELEIGTAMTAEIQRIDELCSARRSKIEKAKFGV